MSTNLTLGYKRKNKFSRSAYILSIIFFTSALLTSIYQYILFNKNYYILPDGISLGSVPVGNMSRENAINKLYSTYNYPITIYYDKSSFLLYPSTIDFKISAEEMLDQLDIPNKTQRYWQFLNGHSQDPAPQNVNLLATYSTDKLRLILEDVAKRYDEPPSSTMTDSTYTFTIVGPPSTLLQVDESLNLISTVLYQKNNREAHLILSQQNSKGSNFEILSQQFVNQINSNNFDGLLSVFIADLDNGTVLNKAWLSNNELSTNPDIAFSGMSIIKITLMIEFYRQITNGALPYELDLVEKAITESSNWTSNKVIEWIGDLDPYIGLQRLNSSYKTMNLNNTFMGGLYDSDELPGYLKTPSNSRTDINTNPDIYMQTTPTDIGNVLTGIYSCSKNNTGLLIDAFGSLITQEECTSMIKILQKNQIGVLLESGVPEGTPIAHKHGWADGEPIADAGIVFTPSTDYVIVIYIWTPEYTYWEENARILSDINKTTYYHFNPIIQSH